MTDAPVRRRGRLYFSVATAVPLALLLLAAAVATASGHDTTHSSLTSAQVSPTSAVAGTVVSFRVTFTDTTGAPPKSVSVYVGSAATAMTGSGSNYTAGVAFSVTAKPAAGTYSITFRSVDAVGHDAQLPYGSLTIAPAPTPTPKPTATPTPKPTASPTPTPTPSPTSKPTPKPTSKPTTTPHPTTATASATTAPRPTPIYHPAVTPSPRTGGGVVKPQPTQRAAASSEVSPSAGVPGLGSTFTEDSGTAGDPIAAAGTAAGSFADLAAYELTTGAMAPAVGGTTNSTAGFNHGGDGSLDKLIVELLPTIATASAGGAAWAAFALFGKRRRDDDESQDALLAAAAAAAQVGYEAGAAPGLDVVDESLLPRWRRPSLQQVRRTDPLRAAEAAPCLSFESSGVRPLEDYERRRIGYRLVRLLDSPDELRSREIGVLDQGDEVQLLQRQGAYWLVLCPDGRQGWLHRMTLADPFQVEQLQAEPELLLQSEGWQAAPEAVEYAADPSADGLLEAYMTARRDVLRTMADESSGSDVTVDVMGRAAFQGATFAAPMTDYTAATPAGVVEVVEFPTDMAGAAAAAAADAASAAAADAGRAAAAAAATTAAEPEVAGSLASELLDARPERAGERYSARKSAGSHKAASASRTDTKSRRPSR